MVVCIPPSFFFSVEYYSIVGLDGISASTHKLDCFYFGDITNDVTMNILCRFLCGCVFSFLLDIKLGVELLAHRVILCLARGGAARLSCKHSAKQCFHIPTSSERMSISPSPRCHWGMSNHPASDEAASCCGFNLHFPDGR